METMKQIVKTNEEELIEEMMRAGVHYGRIKKYTHPLMKPFLLKTNKNIELFNLKITLEKLNELGEFLRQILHDGKTVLFLGTTPASQMKIQEIATIFNQPYINYKWVAGFLTNFQTIQARLLYFKDLLKKEESGELKNYLPQERSKIEKELQKLKAIYSGVINLDKLPDFIFVINLAFNQHITAKREAVKLGIPILAIAGSDNDIFNIFKFVPANDKAPRSISWLIDYLIKKIQAPAGNNADNRE